MVRRSVGCIGVEGALAADLPGMVETVSRGIQWGAGRMYDRGVEWLRERAMASSRDGLWVFDPAGRIRYANERAGELLGRTPAELTSLCVTDLLDEAGQQQFRAHLAEAQETGTTPHDVACSYLTPDGDFVRVLVGESEIRDDDGALVGYLHRMIGDGQEHELLRELRRNQVQLADAQAIARLGSWELDYTAEQVMWTAQMFDILALDPGTEPRIELFFDMLHPDDRAEVQREFVAVQAEEGERSVDARLVLADGSTRWVRAIGRTLAWSEDGRALRVGGTVQDIDAVKTTELRLRDAVELNSLMQFMAAAMNEASTLQEAIRTLRELLLSHWDWNGAVAFEVVDAATGELAPLPIHEAEEHTSLERRTALRALREGGVVFEEELAPDAPSIAFPVPLGADPRIIAVITATTPFQRQPMLRALAEQVAAQMGTVAAREEVAQELAEARDQAMDASEAKTEFVATMSHEIRTPLNGVIGLNDLLLRTELDERQRRLAEGMQGAGRALLRLINDILDFSKIEAGAVELEQVPFRPQSLIDDLVELFQPEASERATQVVATVADSVPAVLVGDPGRFRQVLSNLVSNAIKFTEQGIVTVTATARRHAEQTHVRLEVRDTGVGMTEAQLARVFDPFRQADAATARDFGGTGLGLTIARQLAVALGGEMGSSSTPGVGSAFWFTAAFDEVCELDGIFTEVPIQRSAPAGHVLVVEDNEVNQLVALGMLSELGYTADIAVNGAEAAELVRAGVHDAVLMDLRMPGTDGFEGTRRIRAGEDPGSRLPIIALTASATEGERERCLDVGMDGFLTKPLGLSRLEAELHRCLRGEPAEASDRGESVPGTAFPMGQRMVLDPSRLEELAEMGEAALPLIRRAADNFLSNAPDDLDLLRDAYERGDQPTLMAISHRLKGSAANLGLVELSALAAELEELARSGAEPVGREAKVLLVRLDAAVIEGSRVLRQHLGGTLAGEHV